jgi:Cd2+/Zn2+-exporting ATPase
MNHLNRENTDKSFASDAAHDNSHGGCCCDDCKHGEHDEHGEHEGSWLPPVLSAVLLAVGMVLQHFTPLFNLPFVSAIYYLIAFLPVGIPVVREAWETSREGDYFSEFTLMSVASIGAFLIGEYPEAVAVMLFYTIGEKLQDKAVERATGNISNLLDVRPDTATVVRNQQLVVVSPEDVAVGETIEIKPGERVPLDGVLLHNEAQFDTSALTGESVPRSVCPGGDVLAGMIVSGQTVRVEVTKPYKQSTLARILTLVKDASDRKSPAELFIRRFARIYTPIVMGLAAALIILPWLYSLLFPFSYHFTDWLYRGLVFLVISCPCALVISVPLGYFAGIGAASKLGILFKGGNYLDAITKIDTIAFDKTGTLTKGKFEVSKMEVAEGVDAALLLSLVMSVEAKSTHPIAQAVVTYAQSQHAKEAALSEMKEISGHGVTAVANGKHVAVGNFKLLALEHVQVPEHLTKSIATVVACAIDGHYAGAFLLADALKPDAKQAIASLKALGVNDIHLLSGDKQEIVQEYASQLGIAQAHAELLPEDKAHYIEQLTQNKQRTVAFVGDGMNDAPVLALSNVGIAMGGLGSDAAIESADVVIQNDMPSRVPTAIRIGRFTTKIVRQNIIGAISIKIIILVAGALGYATLWAAVFADVGVALLAVANSLRVMLFTSDSRAS